jgi:hypothetical protein
MLIENIPGDRRWGRYDGRSTDGPISRLGDEVRHGPATGFRVAYEKPFGTSLESLRELDKIAMSVQRFGS